MKSASILLLEFDSASNVGNTLRQIIEFERSGKLRLQPCAIRAREASAAAKESVTAIISNQPDLVFLALSGTLLQSVRAWIEALSRFGKLAPVVIVTETGEPDDLLAWLELGVADFITPPFTQLGILPRIWRLLARTSDQQRQEQSLKEKLSLKLIVGESRSFRAVLDKVPLVAQCDASVLIAGETGTGKELCARAIHYLSPRAHRPFIPVNCGAIPLDLVENELFGHERGAFTDAAKVHPGLIEEADGGTLFLDEIDCLPLLAQVKLLRFLQEKEYRPLGSSKTRHADVRVIAAANTDFEEALRAGKLRRDLYYRLNVIPLLLPPLRERPEDIPLLARHFLAKYAAEFHKPEMRFSAEALRALTLYHWPGNVRELEHIVERIVALAEAWIVEGNDPNLPCQACATRQASFREAKAQIVADFERAYLQNLLLTYHGNITQAAEAAQKNRRAFWQLIRKHHLNAQDFRPPAR